MSALSQFEGATIETLRRVPVGTPAGDAAGIGFVLRLADGSERTLELYTLTRTLELHVRIDGMYVPPEDL